MTDAPEPIAPRCLHLRTKMDYVSVVEGERPSGRPADWDEHITLGGTSHHYYCLHSMTMIGPDNDVVGLRVCTPARACYEAG